MKLNKSSILALMTLGALTAFGPLASADDQPAKPVPPPDAPSTTTPPADATPPAGGRGAGRGPNLQKILDQLNLTDDQKEKIKPLLKDQRDKITALRNDTSLTPEDLRPKMKEIRDATNAKLKTIMTADQYAQWEKLTARRGGRRNAGAPPADAPAPPPAAGDNK